MNQMPIIKEENKVRKSIAREVNCFDCNNNFLIKFVNSSRTYSKKNNWGYWTEREEYNDRYICSDCLKKLYYGDYEKFCKEVTLKRKSVLQTYLALKIL